jgi:outer membrane protein assembly factor BamB
VWRGPKGDGIVADAAVPTKWGATENVLWKAEVPGTGHSSPVVSNGRVFLTSFDPDTGDRLLLCYGRADGKPLWRQTVLTAAAEKMHKNNTPASSTPASDGTHVWVTFLDGDKVAVACYSFAGKRAWQKAFGGFTSQHGFCGTPVLWGDLVIVNGDSDGDAFLAALDKKTGETRWKVERPNRVRSFSVPLFVEVKGKTQMVLAGSKCVAGFDPATGEQLWVADSSTDKFVATVAHADGLIFATGTSPSSTLVALDPSGTGNVTSRTPGGPTPRRRPTCRRRWPAATGCSCCRTPAWRPCWTRRPGRSSGRSGSGRGCTTPRRCSSTTSSTASPTTARRTC